MFGVSESRKPIKGGFAKKILKEVIRMLKNKDKNLTQKDTLG